MFDIVMTIACVAAIGGTWLTYSNSKVADSIRYNIFLNYANILKFLSK